MEMYELEDRTAERDLVAAAARGVAVRVLLDRDFDAGPSERFAPYGRFWFQRSLGSVIVQRVVVPRLRHRHGRLPTAAGP
jgi:hypothetical protein